MARSEKPKREPVEITLDGTLKESGWMSPLSKEQIMTAKDLSPEDWRESTRNSGHHKPVQSMLLDSCDHSDFSRSFKLNKIG